jgi:hypothetical protein
MTILQEDLFEEDGPEVLSRLDQGIASKGYEQDTHAYRRWLSNVTSDPTSLSQILTEFDEIE